MKKEKKISIIVLVILLLGGVYFAYQSWASPTKIAFVKYPEYMLAPLLDQEISKNISVELLNWDEKSSVNGLKKYDSVIFFGMGLNFTEQQYADMEKLKSAVYVTASTRNETGLNTLSSADSAKLNSYLSAMNKENFVRMLNFIRRDIDGKFLFSSPVEEAQKLPPRNGFYNAQTPDKIFPTFEDYINWYKTTTNYNANNPMVILKGVNTSAGFDKLAEKLSAKGINSISFDGARDFLEVANVIKPDGVIYIPHGRISWGDEQEVFDFFKHSNIPLFCPISIAQDYDKFIADQKGMAGGLLSQSIIMPEFDGGVAPKVLFALQKNSRGLSEYHIIEDQADRYVEMIKKSLELKKKANKDKKIAIIFYKEAGNNAMVAGGLEVGDSLFNTLKNLEKVGYTTGALPKNAEELNQLVQENASIFGAYAKGAKESFDEGPNVIKIPRNEFELWAKKSMPSDLFEEVSAKLGAVPAELKLGSLRFGNILLMVQGAPGEADSEDILVHGVKQIPPYSYMATYFYCENGFGADALMHFGTHGSLEFTPWKQVALSSYDWPDILMGSMPHYYLYVTNNVGEALIAKRRSYATIVSHLPAPYMTADATGVLAEIDRAIHNYEDTDENGLKAKYKETIIKLVNENSIYRDINIENPLTEENFTTEIFEKLHSYIEEIKYSKVNRGMYVIGRPYSEEEAFESAKLMTVDRIANELFNADLEFGRVTEELRCNEGLFLHTYRKGALNIIENAFVNGPSKREVKEPESNDSDDEMLDSPMGKVSLKQVRLMASSEKMGKGASMPPAMLAAIKKMLADYESKKKMAKKLAKQELSHEEFAIKTKTDLLNSTQAELEAMLNAFNGGYLLPSFGGDLINSTDAVPTGRNLVGINPENMPTKESFAVGCELADALIKEKIRTSGKYPQKVAFSLWGGEFIRTHGTNIGEIFYLLGVEPIWDSRGSVQDVRLIPMSELKRPRIDVVVQTSGQFRGAATSRMELIDKAVRLAAADPNKEYENFVKINSLLLAESLVKNGMSPEEAKTFSTARLFGGVNGNFGTGVTSKIQSGASWDDSTDIAKMYLNNMGALYTKEHWGEKVDGVFEAALINADTVVQSRSSNSWGALSLDHVYEFTGGISLAIKDVTGNDADAYFNDLRVASRPRIQEAGEAAMVEARSTVLNEKYLKEMMEEGPSAAGTFAAVFQNTYGWEVTRPDMIEDYLWEDYKKVLIDDSLNIGIREFFEDKNPYALQEMTGVMLETIRKGYWDADDKTIVELADLHVDLVQKYEAGCSGFVCNNPKLREMILEKSQNSEAKQKYIQEIDKVLTPKIKVEDNSQNVSGQTLKEETITPVELVKNENQNIKIFIIIGILVFVMFSLFLGKRRR